MASHTRGSAGRIGGGEGRRLARRAASFQSSVWAEVEGLFERHPDMIYFGGGMPAREVIPVERLQQVAAKAWTDAPDALNYGDSAGYPPLRRLIAGRMAARGMAVNPDDIVVTNGSQQAIGLLAQLLLEPGDAIVIEAPTFLDALHVFAAAEASYILVPIDDQGMDVDALARALAGRETPPKLIYTVPTFQNPTGVTMSRARRTALLALARGHGIPVIEDDPYGELRYDGAPEPPLRALDPDVLYLGTFSKTIAPALRVGWVAAPADLMVPLTNAKVTADNNNERITMRTVYHAAEGFLDAHILHSREVYRRRRDALLAGLREHMPAGVRWSQPSGGFFVWVELPPTCAADDLLPLAADRGVTFLPGSWFYPNGEERHGLRLNFSMLPEDRIAEGTRRLGEVIAEFVGAPGRRSGRV